MNRQEIERFGIKDVEFSCLCFDTNNACSFGTDVERFFDTLKSNVNLFPKPLSNHKIEDQSLVATQEGKGLSIAIRKLANDAGNLDYRVGFYIVINFKNAEKDFEVINSFRTELVKYLVDLKFGKVFILRDEFSAILLRSIYAELNKAENFLRAYIIKNFTITEGVGYTVNQIFDGDQKNKTNKRKSNENVFAPFSPPNQEGLVDSRIYLVDFDDLGSIIYSSAFGNLKGEDIVSRIINASSLDELKNGVKAHVDKYFKKFADINFAEKWDYLKLIRHKVAHNGLTTFEEVVKAKEYLSTLNTFLEQENNEIIDTPQRDTFQDIEKTPYTLDRGFKEISRSELITELGKYRRWSESLGRDFFGLKNFLYNIIGGKGYRIGGAWNILEELEREEYIKIEEWVDPNGRFPKQKQIIFLKNLPVYSI